MKCGCPTGVRRIDGTGYGQHRDLCPPQHEDEQQLEDVPEDIKDTFERLGIPQAERKSLAGVGAQYDSELVYHNVREDSVAAAGRGLHRHGERDARRICRHGAQVLHEARTPRVTTSSRRCTARFGPAARLCTCPKGVHVSIPLQSYFRLNAPRAPGSLSIR